MEKLNTEDGQLFVKNLASFVRTHEKALANALQMRRQPSKHAPSNSYSGSGTPQFSSTSSTLAAAFSFGPLNFTSHTVKPAKLTLTPHHLFYLLSRFEELCIPVGPMSVRQENIHTESSPAYVSFLNQPKRSKSDANSIHSVSSVRSVMSGMSIFWSSFGLSSQTSSKSEKARAAIEADLKYLYSAFTKIPCLRLAPDHRARLIKGYEEFPFDTAVPLHSFKNLSALEIIDVDFRSFFGWDRLAEQLRTLTVKRGHVEDPADLLTGIVLDDVDKRRRRSCKGQASPVLGSSASTFPQPVNRHDMSKSASAPGSPVMDGDFSTSASPQSSSMVRDGSRESHPPFRMGSVSPTRPGSKQYRHVRNNSQKIKRSGSGSSHGSDSSYGPRNASSPNLSNNGILPPSKWRFLKHLGLSDNSLTSISATSLAPVANTLHSLDLSQNLLNEVPDSLASLISLRSLDLSNCMIDSLHSLSRNPLPAITALNLRGNRLRSIAGIERLLSLERLDLRDNNLSDPTEIARLTSIPYMREIWVSGNPFTKTHSAYRVTIFNLFRNTPGFSEDIIIDTSGPGYTERKQLIDRVAEPERAPVVRPSEVEIPATHKAVIPSLQTPYPVTFEAHPDKRPGPAVIQTGYEVGSGRRKKGNRRKMVEISKEDSPVKVKPAAGTKPLPPTPRTTTTTDPFIDAPQTTDDGRRKKAIDVAPYTGGEGVNGREIKPTPVVGTIRHDIPVRTKSLFPAIEGVDWNTESDLYKKRLEALKTDVGSGWLSVLGEDTWDTKQSRMGLHHPVSDLGPGTTSRPASTARTSSQIMVSGGD